MTGFLALDGEDQYAQRRDDADGEILNLTHLSRYTINDKALELELLGMFREQLQFQTQMLAAAENAEDWNIAAHSLKGAARSIGAERISRSACALEKAGHDCPDACKREMLAELDRHVSDCLQAIEKML